MRPRLEHYEVISEVYSSDRTLVLSARTNQGDAPVILKVPQSGQRADELGASYNKEARYRRILDQGDVVLERHMGLPMLVIDAPEAISLSDLRRSGETLSLSVWLKIARGASLQLKMLHSHGVVHRAVHPGNLLWHPATGTVSLIDFKSAESVTRVEANSPSRSVLTQSLPYMAPEASGRMNIGVDERSDLYALGATLYELLTSERPFTASDPLELIHQHLTRAPIPPHERRADVPRIISAILLKLLEKSPDRRYQSARGLEFDLDLALKRLTSKGSIPDFELGHHDISDHYRPGGGLFGRDADRRVLLDALDDVQSGERLICIVSGYSGIGKTALVRELREPAILDGGLYAEGKCDQYQRLEPFSAWNRALDSLVIQILGHAPGEQERVRQRILEAVGDNGRLLTDIVPSLEDLIGTQPAISELGEKESRNRLGYVFLSFLQSLADELPPLVIFLDDLQWMDSASLELLESIAHSEELRHLLIAGAYRDNEVQAGHPLKQALNRLEAAAPESMRTVTLQNLSTADLSAMFATTLRMDHAASEQLAAAVHAKTAGNPFASHQWVKRLIDQRVLYFDESRPGWTWDAELVSAMPPAENVVELLVEKMRELPETTLHLLQLGACLGDRFDPEVLATAADSDTESVEDALKQPLEDGLLFRQAHHFKFAHDRVQQAAASTIEAEARDQLHLSIGRQLSMARVGLEDARDLFDVVAHFERARHLIQSEEERRQVARLAIEAARRARSSSAHDVSLRYYRLALEMAGKDAWKEDREEHWQLYLETIQSEFNNANHDEVERMLSIASEQAQSALERVMLFELECQFAVARNDQNAAIDIALRALKLLGIEFETDREGLARQAESLRSEIVSLENARGQLAAESEMENPEHVAAMRVMVSAAGAAYVMRPALWEVLTLQMIRTTLTHGRSPLAAFGYGFYAVLLAGVYGDLEKGYAFGRRSVELMEHYQADSLRAKIINLFDVFVRHWKEHLRCSLEMLPEGLQSSIDYGDFEYGSYNAIQNGKHQVICGCPLEEVLEQQDDYIRLIDRLKMGYHLDFAHVWWQLAHNLAGRAADPHKLASDDYDAEALIPRLLAQSSNFLVFNIYCTQTMLAYLLGRRDEALAASEAAVPYREYVSGMAEIAEHNFFHSLSLLANLEPGEAIHNRGLLRKVVENQRQLGKWARHAPMNFLHKWRLVEAERLRRSSQPHRAMALYEQAIQGASETYYLNDQALANELYAEFMFERGSQFLGSSLLRKALRLYQSWQAYEKVRQLRRLYEAELERGDADDPALAPQAGDSTLNFDVQSALRASLAIAQETEVDVLQSRLMEILSQSAGAQHGFLALKEDAGWLIAAEFDESGAKTAERPLSAASNVPRVLFTAVVRNKKILLIDDCEQSTELPDEPYFERHGIRSALFIPLLHASDVKGVLYLESRQAPRAFSHSNAKVAEILATQAVQAVENVRLMSTLEERVEARTEELMRAKNEIERANASLRSSEERFRLAMQATTEAVFDWNVATGEVYFSPGWKRMLGYAQDELSDSIETWRELIPAEERDSVLSDIQKQLSGGGDSLEIDYRLQHRDGRELDITTRASVVRGSDGGALRVVGINLDVTEERRIQAEITHQALHDPLTDLPNRMLFSERLDRALRLLRRNGTPFAIQLVDLDGFKQCNDTLGHLAGDEILKQTASRMREQLHATDTVARLGGDEFAVIQLGVKRLADVRRVSEKLIARVSDPFELDDGGSVRLGCSIGVRVVDDPDMPTDLILEQADQALYASKNGGRGQARIFPDEATHFVD